ncbi:hypothetical protein CH262_18910 [Rhodococcus sp. 05-2255-1e]|nr:hypothetical protein CH262_18910 [Rhodococcus sp. 05-2255-1e]
MTAETKTRTVRTAQSPQSVRSYPFLVNAYQPDQYAEGLLRSLSNSCQRQQTPSDEFRFNV